MGSGLTASLALGALLALGPGFAVAAIKERRLIESGPLAASVEDVPDWCGPLVDAAIRADQVERFRGDRIELQRMLGRIRAILTIECPEAATIRLTGLVDNVFVFGGVAAKAGNWILVEVPALLTQPAADEPRAPPDPPPRPQPAPLPQAATVEASARCDALAGHPDDPEKDPDIRGVGDDYLDPAPAIAACREALAAEPDNPRVKFELARATLFAGQVEDAITLLLEAAEDGHGAALAYLGDVALYGAAGLESDPETAKALYSRAAEAGFEPAQQLAAEIVPDAKPAAEAEPQVDVAYSYPAVVRAFTAGHIPEKPLPKGHILFYAANALAGVKEECPELIPKDKDWEADIMLALGTRLNFMQLDILDSQYNSGALDNLMQGAMDDGYAVAVVNGCNARATRNFVDVAVSYF